jgi:hypothetical protein
VYIIYVATPKTISSKINTTASVTASSGNAIYITAILASTSLILDGGSAATVGPVALNSPIRCSSFSSSSAGEVAYYEQY